jgi:hypothetical protein
MIRSGSVTAMPVRFNPKSIARILLIGAKVVMCCELYGILCAWFVGPLPTRQFWVSIFPTSYPKKVAVCGLKKDSRATYAGILWFFTI